MLCRKTHDFDHKLECSAERGVDKAVGDAHEIEILLCSSSYAAIDIKTVRVCQLF